MSVENSFVVPSTSTSRSHSPFGFFPQEGNRKGWFLKDTSLPFPLQLLHVEGNRKGWFLKVLRILFLSVLRLLFRLVHVECSREG